MARQVAKVGQANPTDTTLGFIGWSPETQAERNTYACSWAGGNFGATAPSVLPNSTTERAQVVKA
jgi:hypothetical protein